MGRYVDLASPFADLDPTPDELDALAEVMAEIDGGSWPGEDSDEPDGPWHDSTGLAWEDGADPAEIGAIVDLSYATEAQRLEEDQQELPRRAEDRTAWLLDRVARHTYTPPGYFRDPADLANGEPIYGCGIYDDHGRCAARYHRAECIETVRTSAATGNHEAASQFRDVLLSNTATAVELANRTGPGFDDLLEDPGPADLPTYEAMRQLLGLPGRGHRPGPVRPAVQITPQELGLY